MTPPRPAPKHYPCTHAGCGKAFSRRWNLASHARVHNDETPYLCPHPSCPRAFRWKSSLNNHLLSLDHTTPDARAAARQRPTPRLQPAPPPRPADHIANLFDHPPPLAPHPPPAPAALGVQLARHRSPPRRLSGAGAVANRRRRVADTAEILAGEEAGTSSVSVISSASTVAGLSSDAFVSSFGDARLPEWKIEDAVFKVEDAAFEDQSVLVELLDERYLPEWKIEDPVFKDEETVYTDLHPSPFPFPSFGDDTFFPCAVTRSESDLSQHESSICHISNERESTSPSLQTAACNRHEEAIFYKTLPPSRFLPGMEGGPSDVISWSSPATD